MITAAEIDVGHSRANSDNTPRTRTRDGPPLVRAVQTALQHSKTMNNILHSFVTAAAAVAYITLYAHTHTLLYSVCNDINYDDDKRIIVTTTRECRILVLCTYMYYIVRYRRRLARRQKEHTLFAFRSYSNREV